MASENLWSYVNEDFYLQENISRYFSTITNVTHEVAKKFFKLIEKSNSYVSGSFLLGFMNSTLEHEEGFFGGYSTKINGFVPNDIDVYTYGNRRETDLIKKILALFPEAKIQTDAKSAEYFETFNRNFIDADHGEKNNRIIYSVTNITLTPTFNIQVIRVSDNNMFKKLYHSFDLSICRVKYDGKSLMSDVPFGTKEFYVTEQYDREKTVGRVNKYIERGYKFTYWVTKDGYVIYLPYIIDLRTRKVKEQKLTVEYLDAEEQKHKDAKEEHERWKKSCTGRFFKFWQDGLESNNDFDD